MRKIVIAILFTIYLFLTLTITIFLMNYNKFNVVEFKNTLIVTMNKTDMKYQRGSLLFIKKEAIDSIKTGDEVFYYTADQHKILIAKDKIVSIDDVNDDEKTIIFKNSKKYSKDYVIGKVSNMIKVPILGYLLMFLTSKIGYLLFVLLPMLCFFFIQIRLLFKGKNNHEKL